MECMLGSEPKSRHFEDDVCHSVDPDIYSRLNVCSHEQASD
jgi:hypothetical protein